MQRLSLDLALIDFHSEVYSIILNLTMICVCEGVCICDNDLCAHTWAWANPLTLSLVAE